MDAEFLRAGDAWFDGRASALSLVRHRDARGMLLPLEFDGLPFPVRRLFTVAGVPPGAVRGGHGHRRGWQLMICVSGAIRLSLRRDRQQVSMTLTDDGPALLLGAGIWAEQTYLHEQSVLLVACSEAYDPDVYFTDADDAGTSISPAEAEAPT